MRRLLLLSLALFPAFSCTVDQPDKEDDQGQQVVPAPPSSDNDVVLYFTESSAHITNPERGFYKAADIGKNDSAISTSDVKAQVAQGRTLYYLGFYLNSFMSGEISESFLNKIQSSFDALRAGGAKCILRFAYKKSESDKPWDAPQEIVLGHIAQIKPILEKNKDVIFVMQAGFVGVWGEWYYTTNFNYQPSSNADYLPRKQVADALLDALPKEREVSLRTPQFKMRMYGVGLKDTITVNTAHDGSTLSRLGGHNDCFGAAKDDWGTFDQETNDRKFWKADTRYTIMGGETCNVSEDCTCTSSLKDMEDYHWTYLNSGYNTDVISRWNNQGCLDQIKDRLGYRLSLRQVRHSANPKAGETIRVELVMTNSGFAAPMNPRNAFLVFKDNSGNVTKFPLGSDPRSWQPGTRTLVSAIIVPAEHGTVYLELSDPLLQDRPVYSIALANDGIYDSKTGLNKLFEL